MAQINVNETKTMKKLASELTPQNIKRLQTLLAIPPAVVERTAKEPLEFLFSMKYGQFQYEPKMFLDALGTIGRPYLIPYAERLSWLNISSAKQTQEVGSALSPETFVKLLRTEIESKEWKLIVDTGLSEKVTNVLEFETAFQLSIEKELITPNLEELCNMMAAIERHDVVKKIQQYAPVFHKMNKSEFQSKLLEELKTDDKDEQVKWSNALRAYVKQQNKKVSILLDDDETVQLEHVYTPLTVVKEELANLKVGEDTTLNEIAFLKSMSDNVKHLETVDFTELVITHQSDEPEVFILIGNPGSGKTFLCKYLALQYGVYKLNNFNYVLSVPCRNEEWHQMEKE